MDKEIVKALIESEMNDPEYGSYDRGWNTALQWVCNLLDSLEEAKL